MGLTIRPKHKSTKTFYSLLFDKEYSEAGSSRAVVICALDPVKAIHEAGRRGHDVNRITRIVNTTVTTCR